MPGSPIDPPVLLVNTSDEASVNTADGRLVSMFQTNRRAVILAISKGAWYHDRERVLRDVSVAIDEAMPDD